MSEPKLTNAWCWSPSPPASAGNPWLVECWSGSSRFVVHGATQQAAQEQFYLEHPELKGVIHWLFEAPPRPKRPGDPVSADAAIEHDAIPFTALARRFHPDLCGRRKFTADQVMAIVNELRETTKVKS